MRFFEERASLCSDLAQARGMALIRKMLAKSVAGIHSAHEGRSISADLAMRQNFSGI